MTGMDQMVNSLVKNISGMTIDEIKVQAIQAQKTVVQIITTMNDNFNTLHKENLELKQEFLVKTLALIQSLQDLTEVQRTFHEDTIDQIKRYNKTFRSLDSKLDAIRMDLAPLLVKTECDLSPDLVDLLTRNASTVAPDAVNSLGGLLPAWDSPGVIQAVPAPARDESPTGGEELPNSLPPNPTPSESVFGEHDSNGAD